MGGSASHLPEVQCGFFCSLSSELKMEVFILSYKGTIYGVYSTMTAAYVEAEEKFGAAAVMSLAVEIVRRTVKD
jgi:predicted negative regulator of RcsB-dependent stress response